LEPGSLSPIQLSLLARLSDGGKYDFQLCRMAEIAGHFLPLRSGIRPEIL
jgi:hypothetical protein